MMNRFFRRVAVPTVALAALAGCAGGSYGPQSLRTGATLAEATAELGAPTGRYPHSGGERLEYARGAYGKHTYMLATPPAASSTPAMARTRCAKT